MEYIWDQAGDEQSKGNTELRVKNSTFIFLKRKLAMCSSSVTLNSLSDKRNLVFITKKYRFTDLLQPAQLLAQCEIILHGSS